MGGPGSGLNRGSANGATISALDEARCRLIDAEDNVQKCSNRVGWAYHHLKLAEKEVTAAIADLTRLQHRLGDKELTERATSRVDELTVSTQGHPSRLTDALLTAVAESNQANGHLKAAAKRATA